MSSDNKLYFDFLSSATSPKAVSQVQPADILNEAQKIKLGVSSIELALKQANGKIYGEDGAAAILGLKPTTLASRIKKYNIKKSGFQT